MMFQYRHLSRHARVFQHLTGLRLSEFDDLSAAMVPVQEATHRDTLAQREKPRKRAVGGGGQFRLRHRDQLLLAVIWLRRYPTHETLGYVFGVDATTVGRILSRVVALLAQNGRDTMKMPDPGRKRRASLDVLLTQTPELAVIVDSFEQRVQRPRNKAGSGSDQERVKDSHYSGKKKQHTLKSQVSVDEETGQIVDVSQSVPGPTADLRLLQESKVLERLPEGVEHWATWRPWGWTKSTPMAWALRPGASRVAKRGPKKTKPSTTPLPDGASRWSTLLDACAATTARTRWIDIIAKTTPTGWWPSRG